MWLGSYRGGGVMRMKLLFIFYRWRSNFKTRLFDLTDQTYKRNAHV